MNQDLNTLIQGSIKGGGGFLNHHIFWEITPLSPQGEKSIGTHKMPMFAPPPPLKNTYFCIRPVLILIQYCVNTSPCKSLSLISKISIFAGNCLCLAGTWL